ncbi:MAG: hypothetical protein ICV83_18475 [Cytophagales bacterium]|nr:hypothetical protein [Cytophagales bacterium]
MKNNMIRDRLSAFQAELSQKGSDTGFTVGETCFICERAALLIRDYCRPGIEPFKMQALQKLQEALEQADQYYDGRRGNKQPNTVSFTQVVGPAREAIAAFLAEAR